jgi:hypothetical protein
MRRGWNDRGEEETAKEDENDDEDDGEGMVRSEAERGCCWIDTPTPSARQVGGRGCGLGLC